MLSRVQLGTHNCHDFKSESTTMLGQRLISVLFKEARCTFSKEREKQDAPHLGIPTAGARENRILKLECLGGEHFAP